MNGLGQAAGWLTPLLLLPGVAMLIMSTSVRYGQLHEEMHRILAQGATTIDLRDRHFVRRSRLFRNALISLYASVVCLALSGLIGGALSFAEAEAEVALAITGLGILFIVYASATLCREAVISNDTVCDAHVEHIDS